MNVNPSCISVAAAAHIREHMLRRSNNAFDLVLALLMKDSGGDVQQRP